MSSSFILTHTQKRTCTYTQSSLRSTCINKPTKQMLVISVKHCDNRFTFFVDLMGGHQKQELKQTSKSIRSTYHDWATTTATTGFKLVNWLAPFYSRPSCCLLSNEERSLLNKCICAHLQVLYSIPCIILWFGGINLIVCNK